MGSVYWAPIRVTPIFVLRTAPHIIFALLNRLFSILFTGIARANEISPPAIKPVALQAPLARNLCDMAEQAAECDTALSIRAGSTPALH